MPRTEEQIKEDNSNGLEDNGVFLFSGYVDSKSCGDAIRFILEQNFKDKSIDHLNLVVNSSGGNVSDGFALLDIMSGSRLPVWTTGIGMIASMGLLIFIGGKKGKRVLTPNTMILTHQWSGVNCGKEHELIAARKADDLVTDKIMKHYKKHTKMSEKVIRKILLPPEDVWLTAEEALKYGLCDEVKYI